MAQSVESGKKKVLFINPPQSCRKILKHNSLKFPLGFLYMGGHLEKNGHEVKILDCPLYYKKRKVVDSDIVKIGLFPEDIERTIIDFKPHIIGLSCAYTAYESDSFEVLELIKKISKKMNMKILTVLGGAHVSANPKYVLRNKNVDLVVIGEGEETMLEITEKFGDFNTPN